ncbi:MAG: class I mannose-6-phosphate isomerase [Candidatus Hydrogenedentes bacterium]|nr:class I mannose-6-phosphate isomerase [Candidatus Hydrogenedentota bacterium]
MTTKFGILRFHEQYFERIWGGQRLRSRYGKPIPADKSIGEAWLISDHPSAVSVVSDGPHAGRTLHELLEMDADALLGSRTKLTPHGRFPLLLKLLDSTDVLSVQVHPDDATAAALGEPDVGKTEMWHILHAEPGAELFCGLTPGTTPEQVRASIEAGSLEGHLLRFKVKQGDSIFVPAGTVHAIGAGIVLAEIQQNSDLTYRLYDWNRVDASGRPRDLHIDKALKAIHFDYKNSAENIIDANARAQARHVTDLVSSAYFSARLCTPGNPVAFQCKGLFFIILCISSCISVSTETLSVGLESGQACLLPACADNFTLSGGGQALVYSA